MKKLDLRSNLTNRFLEIPVEFIDRFMPSASSDSLKVYLYLLRVSNDPRLILSVSDMAELLDITRKRVIEALTGWAELGVLALDYSADEITGITLLPFPVSQEFCTPSTGAVFSSVQETPSSETYASVRRYDSSVSEGSGSPVVREVSVREAVSPVSVQEVSAADMPVHGQTAPAPENLPSDGTDSARSAIPTPRIDYTKLDNDPVFLELMALSEVYLKQPVTPTGKDALAYCYVLLGENSELIEYLLEYCVDRGHSSFHYIKAVADGWYRDGFRTLSDVKEHSKNRSRTVYSIMNEFGIRNREPARIELDYIEEWSSAFELPVILEACKRTMSGIHTPDFNYTNGILSRWKAANVTSLRDIAELDSRHQETVRREQRKAKPAGNSFHNFQGRTVDYDALFAGCRNS